MSNAEPRETLPINPLVELLIARCIVLGLPWNRAEIEETVHGWTKRDKDENTSSDLAKNLVDKIELILQAEAAEDRNPDERSKDVSRFASDVG
jgi:hypothetical protein